MKCPNPKCGNTQLRESHTFCFDCGAKILKPNEEECASPVDDNNQTPATNVEDSDVQGDTDISPGKIGEYKVDTCWTSCYCRLLSETVPRRKNETVSESVKELIHFRFLINDLIHTYPRYGSLFGFGSLHCGNIVLIVFNILI